MDAKQNGTGASAHDDFLAGGEEVSVDVWKAKEKGDALVGVLRSIRTVETRYGPTGYAVFSPVVTREAGALDAFREVQVILTTALAMRLTASVIGCTLAVVYDGEQESKSGGAPLRAYSVVVQSGEKLARLLADVRAPADMIEAVTGRTK